MIIKLVNNMMLSKGSYMYIYFRLIVKELLLRKDTLGDIVN